MTPVDFHTHRLDAAPGAVISVSPSQLKEVPNDADLMLSVGVHPWDSDRDDLNSIIPQLYDPRVVAIGETGLDKLRGASMERQMELFRCHVAISEALCKPLIIHCVKAWDELLLIRKELRPVQNWGIHGFRGGSRQALQLTGHGLFISLGERFNREAAGMIPADYLLAETDDSIKPIGEIIESIAACRHDTWSPQATLAQFLTSNHKP